MVRKGVGVTGRVNRDAVVRRQVGFHETADDLKDSIMSDAISPLSLSLSLSLVINPWHACAVRVTVVGFVCLCVCLLSHCLWGFA